MLKLTSKAEEAEFLQEADRLALSSEKQQRIQHSRAMSHYRDENKKVIHQGSSTSGWSEQAGSAGSLAVKSIGPVSERVTGSNPQAVSLNKAT